MNHSTNAASFSELYHVNGTNGGYDNLNRLTDFRRGVLSKSSGSSVYDTITTSSGTRNWTLDAQGNWSKNPSADNYAVNLENQYTTISSGTNSLSFGYGADGNMTTCVDHSGFNSNGYVADTFAYDAWDRLASFTHTIYPGNTITETDFNYDALGRRAQTVVTQTGSAAPTDDLIYSVNWQVLEDDRTISGTYTRSQYVWSPTYVNDLVLRDRDTTHDNTFAERLYVQQDANHNVTAITDTNGNVLERFIYDPYGTVTVKSAGWGSASDTKNWVYMFQGGRYDSYTGLINYQRREYDPLLGRWMEQDPTGTKYVDGANLYQFVGDNPTNWTDSSGLSKSGDLTSRLNDLEGRLGYDKQAHGGMNGPDHDWLANEISKTRNQLAATPTAFAIYRRGLAGAGGCDKCLGNTFGGHQFVATVEQPWIPGQLIGYAITNTSGQKGTDQTVPEYFAPGSEYTLISVTYRSVDQVQGLGKDSAHATDEEIAAAIRAHAMDESYNYVLYNCQHWASAAVRAAGLREQTH